MFPAVWAEPVTLIDPAGIVGSQVMLKPAGIMRRRPPATVIVGVPGDSVIVIVWAAVDGSPFVKDWLAAEEIVGRPTICLVKMSVPWFPDTMEPLGPFVVTVSRKSPVFRPMLVNWSPEIVTASEGAKGVPTVRATVRFEASYAETVEDTLPMAGLTMPTVETAVFQ